MTLHSSLFLVALIACAVLATWLWYKKRPWEKRLRQAHLEEPETDAVIEGPPSRIVVIAP